VRVWLYRDKVSPPADDENASRLHRSHHGDPKIEPTLSLRGEENAIPLALSRGKAQKPALDKPCDHEVRSPMRRKYKSAIRLAIDDSRQPSRETLKTLIDELLVPGLVEEYLRQLRHTPLPADSEIKSVDLQGNYAFRGSQHDLIQS